MHVLVNGVRLFFDVEGAQLVPDGPRMRQRPTLVLLHGGPGADHSVYRPQMAALAEVAQVIYLDHRGNGRSEAGPQHLWTLAQWADDVVGFCAALGVQRPVVLGASFGGMVAMAYATRHPAHPSRLVLISTAAQGGAYTDRRVALFRQLGGDAAGDLAHRRLVLGDTSPAVLDDWLRICVPIYKQARNDPDVMARGIRNAEATRWFSRADGEGSTFDLRADLARVQCPTLVLGGALDPMLPVENQRDIAALLPQHLVQVHEFASAGHGVLDDEPLRAMALLRDFVAAAEPPARRDDERRTPTSDSMTETTP